nr:cytochrome P450 6k1-like [Leptinotarsa decemlineata]
MAVTSSWILDVFILFAIASFLLYKYSTRKFNYWKKRRIYNPKPLPFLGNFLDVFLLRCTLTEWFKNMYDSVNEPYFGIFVFDEPFLVIKSPELIKNITIKDFSYFMDRAVALPTHNKIQSQVLFFQKSPEWKNDRVRLSPNFSSGKMKRMFPVISDISQNLVRYLDEHQEEVKVREVVGKYLTDITAKCFLGINSRCFDDYEAIFYKMAKDVFNLGLRNSIMQTMYLFKPNWVSLFHLDFAKKIHCDIFSEAVSISMRERTNRNVNKSDYVDILGNLNFPELNIDKATEKITGQLFQFFLAGYETTSTTIAVTLHELSLNPDIQNKLRKEILISIDENRGITYEAIQNMKYLRMCVTEVLRKYPIIPFLSRTCNEDYKVPGTNVVIEKGMSVLLPSYSVQMDKKYFPEPTKYNPDRFLNIYSNENGLCYLPFGAGPRNCIGERFALLVTKMALCYILSEYEIQTCDPAPMESISTYVLLSKIGSRIRFKKITTKST